MRHFVFCSFLSAHVIYYNMCVTEGILVCLAYPVERPHKCFVFPYSLYGEAVENDAQHWEDCHQFDVECRRETHCRIGCQQFEIGVVVIDEHCVCRHIANQEDGAEDGEPQLTHPLSEEQDAQPREEQNHDEQDAETPRTAGRGEGVVCSIG